MITNPELVKDKLPKKTVFPNVYESGLEGGRLEALGLVFTKYGEAKGMDSRLPGIEEIQPMLPSEIARRIGDYGEEVRKRMNRTIIYPGDVINGGSIAEPGRTMSPLDGATREYRIGIPGVKYSNLGGGGGLILAPAGSKYERSMMREYGDRASEYDYYTYSDEENNGGPKEPLPFAKEVTIQTPNGPEVYLLIREYKGSQVSSTDFFRGKPGGELKHVATIEYKYDSDFNTPSDSTLFRHGPKTREAKGPGFYPFNLKVEGFERFKDPISY